MSQPEHLKDILPDLSWQDKPPSTHTLFKLTMGWRQIAGPELFKHSSPLKLKSDHLTLGIKDPTLLFECQSNQNVWIKKVNTFLGEELIKRLSFRLIT